MNRATYPPIRDIEPSPFHVAGTDAMLRVESRDSLSLRVTVASSSGQTSVELSAHDAARLTDWLVFWLNGGTP